MPFPSLWAVKWALWTPALASLALDPLSWGHRDSPYLREQSTVWMWSLQVQQHTLSLHKINPWWQWGIQKLSHLTVLLTPKQPINWKFVVRFILQWFTQSCTPSDTSWKACYGISISKKAVPYAKQQQKKNPNQNHTHTNPPKNPKQKTTNQKNHRKSVL